MSKLTLVESLQASIEALDNVLKGKPPVEGEDILPQPKSAEIIDFATARAHTLGPTEVAPETILKMALKDCEAWGTRAVKAYITVVLDDGVSFSQAHYRAGLTREQEIAFRQLGLAECMDGWRGLIREE